LRVDFALQPTHPVAVAPPLRGGDLDSSDISSHCSLSTVHCPLSTINMLNREQVHKVALLARLELSAEEEEQYAGQMSSILDYFEQLSELDTDHVEPTTRAIDMSNITRTDTQSDYQNLAGIYAAAPDREEEFFKVPRIMT
jgi:aspartyl-tRNA(Asn)/glutamyl-tRNA(Gln) amidotransferase subunit C